MIDSRTPCRSAGTACASLLAGLVLVAFAAVYLLGEATGHRVSCAG